MHVFQHLSPKYLCIVKIDEPQKLKTMKKIVRNILAVAVMLGTYTSYASTDNTLPSSFEVKKGQYIVVTNASGKVIFSGQFDQSTNLNELYDFKQLEDGMYSVEITKAFEIEVNSVQVLNNNVTFIESAKEKIFKPVVRTEDTKVMISKLALNAKTMKVELYFEGDLFHSEVIEGEEVLNRIYQLDRSLPGDYTAIIKADDRVYVEHFRI